MICTRLIFRSVKIALAALLLLSFDAAVASEKPNVIIVITDDQGTGDLGCNGNPYIITPALDDFKEEAVYFSNFHVSTTCAPSSGALMTGRHTNRLNVFHAISGRSLLFEDKVILPQVLSDNGELEKYQGYCTDVFFNEALDLIEANRDRPFFCYLSTNAPHGPLNVPEKYVHMYRELEQVLD